MGVVQPAVKWSKQLLKEVYVVCRWDLYESLLQ